MVRTKFDSLVLVSRSRTLCDSLAPVPSVRRAAADLKSTEDFLRFETKYSMPVASLYKCIREVGLELPNWAGPNGVLATYD